VVGKSVTRLQLQGFIVLIFAVTGSGVGWYFGTKRVRRRSVFGNDYVGSPNQRRIIARRQFMRLVWTFLYGLAGAVVGAAFVLVTRRR